MDGSAGAAPKPTPAEWRIVLSGVRNPGVALSSVNAWESRNVSGDSALNRRLRAVFGLFGLFGLSGLSGLSGLFLRRGLRAFGGRPILGREST